MINISSSQTKAIISLACGSVLLIWLGLMIVGATKIIEIKTTTAGLFLSSFGGLVLGVLGVIFGIKGLRSVKKSFAIFGIILCVLGLLISLYFFIVSFIMGGLIHLLYW